MGTCTSKPPKPNPYASRENQQNDYPAHTQQPKFPPPPPPLPPTTPFLPVYTPSPAHPNKPKNPSTPLRFFRGPFPPPSPAKHIRAVLRRRKANKKAENDAKIVEGEEDEEEEGVELDKRFGFSKELRSRLELGEEVGRGHFGYTCSAKFKKGEGGKYSEDDAKAVMLRILNVVAFCHLQGVVHRDLKPENFLYTSKEDNSLLKAIDFGLSDFVRPDERLNDIVGSAYYVAPEVLHRSYSTEADVWSIGVIAYILLCGSRPFWARTESGIFRAVLKADPNFNEAPWPSLSSEAKDFVKRLLNKDPRKRMTAAQALSHPWIQNHNDVKVPLDILIFRLMKTYMRSSTLRKAALKALSKTLTVDELFYLREQFALLEPKNGSITLDNIKTALMKKATDAMKASHIPDFLFSLNALQYIRMDFEEFCAAALSVHQLEALDRWEQHARCAYEFFDKDGNRAIVVEELASELGLGPSIPVHAVLNDWIRHTDGKLSFLGFVKLLRGPSNRTLVKAQ
ncbi:hypothetical protein CRYUN_Cryun06bG0048000 [Craigia yunnanensis]